MSTPIMERAIPEYRGLLARLLNRFYHRHYVVRMTYTIDDTPWALDPNCLDFCACGAQRHAWNRDAWH
jgi:hypothetical protein